MWVRIIHIRQHHRKWYLSPFHQTAILFSITIYHEDECDSIKHIIQVNFRYRMILSRHIGIIFFALFSIFCSRRLSITFASNFICVFDFSRRTKNIGAMSEKQVDRRIIKWDERILKTFQIRSFNVLMWTSRLIFCFIKI